MIDINYQKRKNIELFENLEKENTLFLSKPQNYIPIYSRFFSLNENNYNNINLNHKNYITNIKKKVKNNKNTQIYKIKNKNKKKIKKK